MTPPLITHNALGLANLLAAEEVAADGKCRPGGTMTNCRAETPACIEEKQGEGGEAQSEATSALRMSMRFFIGSGLRLQLHEVRMAALVAQGPAWGPA